MPVWPRLSIPWEHSQQITAAFFSLFRALRKALLTGRKYQPSCPYSHPSFFPVSLGTLPSVPSVCPSSVSTSMGEWICFFQQKDWDTFHIKEWSLYFFKRLIDWFMRDKEREREAEIQPEGEAGSPQGTWCETESQDSRSRPEPKADTQPLSYPGISIFSFS